MSLVILIGPSASGKTTVYKKLVDMYPNEISRVKTSTTRERRFPSEDDYNFISIEEFSKNIQEDFFLEYEEVYTSVFYGTRKTDVSKALKENIDKYVFLILDVNGAIKVKKELGSLCTTIFLNPGGWDIIENRLQNRINKDGYNERLIKYNLEMSFEKYFDFSVYSNTDIKETCNNIYDYLSSKKENKRISLNLYGNCDYKKAIACKIYSDLKLENYDVEIIFNNKDNSVSQYASLNKKLESTYKNVHVIINNNPYLEILCSENTTLNLESIIIEEYNKFTNIDIVVEYSEQKEIKEILDSKMVNYDIYQNEDYNNILKTIKSKIK